jgi:ParB-like chromosome segregation protein Spo0J
MNVFKLPIHSAAQIFPMLSDEELDELAADIKANGLLHPVVVKDGVIIDGRNRLEACKRAGIEPRIEELNGSDLVSYILSANINRRHMTKGQRAMAVAKIYPEPENKTGPGKRAKASTVLENKSVSFAALSQARTVLKFLPEMAELVLIGVKTLNEAYEEARELKDRTDSEPVRLKRLKEIAPDLADLVAEERMALNEAMAAAEARALKERTQRQALWTLLEELIERADVIHGARLDYAVDNIMKFPKECPMKSLKKFLDQILDDAENLKRRTGL